MNKRKIINDPVYGFITIPTELIYDLIEHPYFQRLNRIKQLGLTYLVYPGAQHTRMQHAFGAMHLMNEALDILRSKGVEISTEEAEAVTIAILLHDLGHGPFSHSLEKLIVTGITHEQLTLIMMDRMNQGFTGRLNLCITILRGKHPKKFLHQLVSSQLDMDRLDYLNRDSFFTGVAEGVIGYDRIIKMLTVRNNELAVEEKGIYSIEKFLISRRLMYWQVYMHKTVLAAEEMLIQIMKRARELSKSRKLSCPMSLLWFLENEVDEKQISSNEEILLRFANLDDSDIIQAIKEWRYDKDKVLAFLCDHLLSRKLLKIELQAFPIDEKRIVELKSKLKNVDSFSPQDYDSLIISGTTTNHAYNPTAESIRILFKNGSVKDVGEASELLNISALKNPVIKYYLCYPRELG
ncbi:MAG: HD domain-containing protein [Chitinophagales bacterium]